MTSNFDKHGSSKQRPAVSQSSSGQSAPAAALDNLKRDRFELLSAYLDGEVTVSERRQVEHWLKTDQNIRCLYSRLLKLRQGMQAIPVPASERSVEQTIESVYKKVDRSPKVVVAWVGAAIALLTVPLFAEDLRFGFANSVPDPETTTIVAPDNTSDSLDVKEIIRQDTGFVGNAAAGQVSDAEKQLQNISKDDVMIQLDKAVFPIPTPDSDVRSNDNGAEQ